MLKLTTDDIDEKDWHWSLSWHPDGRSDSFTREAILKRAPASSGVYGLFNFDCQIFIGEADNIQEALLRHESETDFQSRHLRPTGFTFETCGAELRKAKAGELIARFRPVLQNEAALTPGRFLPEATSERDAGAGYDMETRPDERELPAHHGLAVRRRFRASRRQLAVMFVAIAAVIYYFGVPSDRGTHEQRNAAGEHAPARISVAQILTSAWTWSGLGPQKASSTETAGSLGNRRDEGAAAAAPAAHDAPSLLHAAAQPPQRGNSVAPGASLQAAAPAGARTAHTTSKWSVQISAAPAREIADALAQRLRDEGHESYVVPAEVKGKTYYRVRVGPFSERDEAESTRRALAGLGVYRDAFLSRD